MNSLSCTAHFVPLMLVFISGCGNAGSSSAMGSGGTSAALGTGGAQPGAGGALGGGGTGGKTASGGTEGSAVGGQPATGGTGNGPDGFPVTCVETLPATPGERAPLQFSIKLEVAGKPFVFGETNMLPGGGTVLPTNLRFYVSELALLKANQERVPVDLVNPQGVREGYNVHFVNADDSASLNLRVRAPLGTYAGVEFLLGLTDGCNSTFAPLAPPLDEASQLKWPHTSGYLFLRYEGMVNEPSAVMPPTPQMIHMGGGIHERLAPRISVMGPIEVTPAGAAIPLTFALDQVLKGATMPADLDGFMLPPPAPPGPIGAEILAGETLRQNTAKVTIFSLGQP